MNPGRDKLQQIVGRQARGVVQNLAIQRRVVPPVRCHLAQRSHFLSLLRCFQCRLGGAADPAVLAGRSNAPTYESLPGRLNCRLEWHSDRLGNARLVGATLQPTNRCLAASTVGWSGTPTGCKARLVGATLQPPELLLGRLNCRLGTPDRARPRPTRCLAPCSCWAPLQRSPNLRFTLWPPQT